MTGSPARVRLGRPGPTAASEPASRSRSSLPTAPADLHTVGGDPQRDHVRAVGDVDPISIITARRTSASGGPSTLRARSWCARRTAPTPCSARRARLPLTSADRLAHGGVLRVTRPPASGSSPRRSADRDRRVLIRLTAARARHRAADPRRLTSTRRRPTSSPALVTVTLAVRPVVPALRPTTSSTSASINSAPHSADPTLSANSPSPRRRPAPPAPPQPRRERPLQRLRGRDDLRAGYLPCAPQPA